MEVIELSSDSNDSEPSDKAISTKAIISPIPDDNDNEFDFPEVPFSAINICKHESKSKSVCSNAVSQSNDDLTEKLIDKYLNKKATGEGTYAKINDEPSCSDKDLLKIQKLKDSEEAARKKAEKTAVVELIENMNPEECMQYIQVAIDRNFNNLSFFDSFMSEIKNFELVYQQKSQVVPNSITWIRSAQKNGNILDVLGMRESVIEEDHIIIVWDYTEAVSKISDGTFVSSILNIQSLIPGKVGTLVVYGIENYFRHHKNSKKMRFKNQCQGNPRNMTKRRSKTFDDLPVISRKDLELCLTEIQIRIKYNSQLIETPQSLGLLISQYTKAIAEAPFKAQKKMLEAQLGWYAAADNRDTVRVDKNGNGLKRLWQQQLCQFNLAKLETAEAIISKYSTPVNLMEAYARCTPSEGAALVRDIPIRRTAGPLTAVRKIGPELSKKLYVMFTTKDGDIVLGND